MGKKKSVVLLTLITIVIVVLCALAVVPSFHLSVFREDSVKTWNPVVSLYDLDEDLGGGYVARFYPKGIISGAEYESDLLDYADDADTLEEYKNSYAAFNGLYLSTDPDDGILTKNDGATYEVTEAFKKWIDETVTLVSDRFARMGYSSLNVSVIDGYALEVKIPASSSSVSSSAMQALSYTGSLSVSDDSNTYPSKTEQATDYFRSFKLKTSGNSAYIQIKATDLGSEKLAAFKENSSSSTVSFKIGDNTLISPQGSYLENLSGNTWAIGVTSKDSGKVLAIALDSALHSSLGDSGFALDSEKSEIGTYEAVYGKNGKTLLYVAALIALAIAVVLPLFLYKGYGVAMAYGTMTYFVIVAFLYAYVTNAVFEISVGSAIAFIAGLALIFALNSRVYAKIKEEVSLGKTVDSSVKNAFRKTLLPAVDACVAAVLSSIAFLIGAAGLQIVAAQCLICFAAASFVCLIWTRVLNCMLVSAAKDKYAFYRLKREDDDDE